MTAPEPAIGVIVMAYGTPGSPDEVESYYTHIRRGRPPTAEQLADLERRYAAIGGTSPLAGRTRAQAQGIQDALDGTHGPGSYRVVLGNKHAAPFIEDGIAELRRAGVERAVGLVLAPHYSVMSVGEYHERARHAAEAMPYGGIDSWHLEPALIELLAERTAAALSGLDGRVEVLFTAHSLPQRILEMNDPYPRQLEETAAAVAKEGGIDSWRIAWQSAGRTPEPWLGPDILDVIRGLPDEGIDAVVVCPAGFVSDHLEVLFDIDVDAARVASEVGVGLARTESLNDDSRFLAMLAGLVARA